MSAPLAVKTPEVLTEKPSPILKDPPLIVVPVIVLPDIAAPVIFPLASTLNVPLLFFIVAPVIVEPLVISP